MTYTYTIPICHRNMRATVERSVRSIYELTDERFEIVIVDGCSTDGSVKIIERLADSLDRVRVVYEQNGSIGGARAEAVEHARGEYILHQLDADDEYYAGIIDFVEIFHQIESQVNFDPFLRGKHIHICHRDVVEKVNYRPIGYNEDRDFWRRLIAAGHFIGLIHKPIKSGIGYGRSGTAKARARFNALVTQLRSGITARSYAAWLAEQSLGWRPNNEQSLPAIAFRAITLLPALVVAIRQGRYEAPPELSDMRIATRALVDNIHTLSGIERRYGISIDREKLSAQGREIYDIKSGDEYVTRLWCNNKPSLESGSKSDV